MFDCVVLFSFFLCVMCCFIVMYCVVLFPIVRYYDVSRSIVFDCVMLCAIVFYRPLLCLIV